MNVTYRIDKDILYISIEGRIDASNAPVAEEKIFAIKNDNPGKHVVLDADYLEYISSAGLRVILRLRKEEPKLAIINVASGNSEYKSVDSVLFSADGKTLIAYPAGNTATSYAVPADVTVLSANAFAGCKYLEAITMMPRGIYSISTPPCKPRFQLWS